ncbi:MAG: DUF3810 domain-containing protein [Chitinophagaceae bacterium]|nr:MAG: DUF3810 domain-containing protein [Chitinophagaceae bacterium]
MAARTPPRSPFRDPLLWLLAAAVVLLQWFAASPERVEQVYSQGLYPAIGRSMRTLFGWLPFSFGDLLYFAAGLFLLLRLIRLLRWTFRRQLKAHLHARAFIRTTKVALVVYLLFQCLWGLNYSRQGIAAQAGVQPVASDTARLQELALLLQDRLCTWAARVDTSRRGALSDSRQLFRRAEAAYASARKEAPFLAFSHPSAKPSLYSPVAHLFGFSGYYNPFTGEAQIHTGFPDFLQPFVTCHEMGHQVGYARENEANFAGFLAACHSGDADFVYSAYFEMYLYTLRELAQQDPRWSIMLRRSAHERVRRDFLAYRNYLLRKQNAMEPVVSKFYDGYLRLNKQEHGLETYDEVVLWLLAYLRKYGPEAI